MNTRACNRRYFFFIKVSGMYKSILIIIGLVLSPCHFFAQNIPHFRILSDLAPPLMLKENQALPNAWSGGLNAPIFSKLDLNQDGVEDLIAFEKTTQKLFCFLALPENKHYSYRYAPEFDFSFPSFVGWVLFRDYNQDGKKDIFAHTNFGIQVYKNISSAGELKWKKMADPLLTQGYRGEINLQVNIIDLPAILDLDGDGDLDIVTFDFASGSNLELHKNLSQEQQGNAEALVFKKITSCWGGIFEGATCGDFTFGVNCNRQHNGSGGGSQAADRIKHVGSSICLLDLNGDQALDALIGDVSCPHLYRMINTRNNQDAQFNEYAQDFPPSYPVNLPIFPAAVHEDVDFDGKKDLLVIPNVFSNQADAIDFQHSIWYYKNEGDQKQPDFQFQQSDFLQSGMLDLGEAAFPALADYDGDGDLDLWLGQKGSWVDSAYVARLYYFENIGDAKKASFILRDKDFLDLSKLQGKHLRPFLIDYNQDGQMDLAFTLRISRKTNFFISYRSSDKSGKFLFSPPQLLDIPLELGDFPHFVDLDGDTDLDLLIGRRGGNLSYFQNQGSTQNPDYQVIEKNFLEIPKNSSRRNLIPLTDDFNRDGKLDLLTGDASGELRFYSDIFSGEFSKEQVREDLIFSPRDQSFLRHSFGLSIFPTLADLNQDQAPEIILGSRGGGLFYLKNETFNPTLEIRPPVFKTLRIVSKPQQKEVLLECELPLEVEIYADPTSTLLKKELIFPNKTLRISLKNDRFTRFLFKFRDPDGKTLVRKIDL